MATRNPLGISVATPEERERLGWPAPPTFNEFTIVRLWFGALLERLILRVRFRKQIRRMRAWKRER